jgi:hypothetical protein
MLNVGNPDRVIRVILGALLILVPFVVALPAWAFWVAIVTGIVLVATAAIGFCPIYYALGLRTRPRA